jgi:hypothetical protein
MSFKTNIVCLGLSPYLFAFFKELFVRLKKPYFLSDIFLVGFRQALFWVFQSARSIRIQAPSIQDDLQSRPQNHWHSLNRLNPCFF